MTLVPRNQSRTIERWVYDVLKRENRPMTAAEISHRLPFAPRSVRRALCRLRVGKCWLNMDRIGRNGFRYWLKDPGVDGPVDGRIATGGDWRARRNFTKKGSDMDEQERQERITAISTKVLRRLANMAAPPQMNSRVLGYLVEHGLTTDDDALNDDVVRQAIASINGALGQIGTYANPFPPRQRPFVAPPPGMYYRPGEGLIDDNNPSLEMQRNADPRWRDAAGKKLLYRDQLNAAKGTVTEESPPRVSPMPETAQPAQPAQPDVQPQEAQQAQEPQPEHLP